MIIWIQVGVSQDCDVLLEVLNLIIQIDKLLSLLFNQKWSICNIKVNDSSLLIPYIFKELHLVPSSLKTILSLFLQDRSITRQSRRLLDSLSKSCLLHFSLDIFSLFYFGLFELLNLIFSSHCDKSLMLLCSRWINSIFSEVGVYHFEVLQR